MWSIKTRMLCDLHKTHSDHIHLTTGFTDEIWSDIYACNEINLWHINIYYCSDIIYLSAVKREKKINLALSDITMPLHSPRYSHSDMGINSGSQYFIGLSTCTNTAHPITTIFDYSEYPVNGDDVVLNIIICIQIPQTNWSTSRLISCMTIWLTYWLS